MESFLASYVTNTLVTSLNKSSSKFGCGLFNNFVLSIVVPTRFTNVNLAINCYLFCVNRQFFKTKLNVRSIAPSLAALNTFLIKRFIRK